MKNRAEHRIVSHDEDKNPASGERLVSSDAVTRLDELQRELQWRKTALDEAEVQLPKLKADFLELGARAAARQVEVELVSLRQRVQDLQVEVEQINEKLHPLIKQSLRPSEVPYIRGAHRLRPSDDRDQRAA